MDDYVRFTTRLAALWCRFDAAEAHTEERQGVALEIAAMTAAYHDMTEYEFMAWIGARF